jgi:hypothetical protein
MIINIVEDATTNEATTTVFINKNQDATTNDATMNAQKYYRPWHAREYDLSSLLALIRASDIIFVAVCKVQLSAYLYSVLKLN